MQPHQTTNESPSPEKRLRRGHQRLPNHSVQTIYNDTIESQGDFEEDEDDVSIHQGPIRIKMITCETNTEPDSQRDDKRSVEDEKAQGTDTPKNFINCLTDGETKK